MVAAPIGGRTAGGATIGAMRPGYGSRHPDFVRLMAGRSPARTEPLAWTTIAGAIDLHVGACPVGLPDELVTSIRCIVTVGDGVLVCTTPNEQHCMPGGRREPGETWEQTVRREVAEETGWEVGELVPVGFLHFRIESPSPEDNPYPWPDIVQVVFHAEGIACAAEGWQDTEGWEQATDVVPFADALALPLSPAELALLTEINRRR